MACWMALKLRNTAHEFWRRFLRLNNFFLLKNMPKVQGKVFQTLSLTGFLFFSAIWWTVCKTKDIFWSWKFVINWLDKNKGNSALRFLSRNPSKDFRNPFTTFFLTYPFNSPNYYYDFLNIFSHYFHQLLQNQKESNVKKKHIITIRTQQHSYYSNYLNTVLDYIYLFLISNIMEICTTWHEHR